MTLSIVSTNRSYGGTQGVYRHRSSTTNTEMTFSVFVPPGAPGETFPVVWFLSGLTCTHANVMEKGDFRRACSALKLIFVAPDTSPRGNGVPDDPNGAYDFGLGAGFYVDAVKAPYDKNYRMYSYMLDELTGLVGSSFPADLSRQAIIGHSMGGHGALMMALRNPQRFRSASAFAPIVAPSQVPWGQKAFSGYLGSDAGSWRAYDTVALIEDGHRFPEFLVDVGSSDQFLAEQLRPELLEATCAHQSIGLTLRHQEGYDHSYYFISTFMDQHLRWHAERLSK